MIRAESFWSATPAGVGVNASEEERVAEKAMWAGYGSNRNLIGTVTWAATGLPRCLAGA